MSNMFYFEKLFKKTATGAIQEWLIGVEGSTIVTTYGQVGGKMQTTRDSVKLGKNLGRKNATDRETQARAEADSRWAKKKKSGYVGSMKEAEAEDVDMLIEGGVIPMLAKVYEDHCDKITGQVAIQPKLDGGRMIAVIDGEGKVTLWTRTRKRIKSMDHVVEKLEELADTYGIRNQIFDGEAYHEDIHKTVGVSKKLFIPEGHLDSNAKEINFEKLMSAFRKDRTTEESRKLQYHIYDCVNDTPFQYRFGFHLAQLIQGEPIIQCVPTDFVTGEDEIYRYHKKFIAQGYEGSMIRGLQKGYEHKRSDQLLKLKNFLDAEFKIVGVEEGRGKLEGHCGAFVCVSDDGKNQFRAKMSGSTEKLREYFANKEDYIGQLLTVKYQSMTAYGVPRFPVGLRIREDL